MHWVIYNDCNAPETIMENYRRGLALINSKKHYDELADGGFFTIVREDDGADTKEEVCDSIAKYSGRPVCQTGAGYFFRGFSWSCPDTEEGVTYFDGGQQEIS